MIKILRFNSKIQANRFFHVTASNPLVPIIYVKPPSLGLPISMQDNVLLHENSEDRLMRVYDSRIAYLKSYKPVLQSNTPEDHDKNFNPKQLSRKANLGTMIQMLQLQVPNLLSSLLPHEFISDSIILKLLPNQFPNFPVIKGYLLYSTTFKAIQLVLTSFYLNPNAKIHVTDIKILEPTSSLSSDELINLSIGKNVIENSTHSENQNTSNYTTKIKFKWRTCLTGCPHLQDSNTTSAKMGSFSLDHFDWTKLLKSTNPLQAMALLEARKTIEGLTKSIKKLDSDVHHQKPADKSEMEQEVQRVVTGVFNFELNADNNSIVVFTIDNMEILESKEMDLNNGCFAA